MTMEDEALQSNNFEKVPFYNNCYNFFDRLFYISSDTVIHVEFLFQLKG